MTEQERRRKVDLFVDVLVAAVLVVLIWMMAGCRGMRPAPFVAVDAGQYDDETWTGASFGWQWLPASEVAGPGGFRWTAEGWRSTAWPEAPPVAVAPFEADPPADPDPDLPPTPEEPPVGASEEEPGPDERPAWWRWTTQDWTVLIVAIGAALAAFKGGQRVQRKAAANGSDE